MNNDVFTSAGFIAAHLTVAELARTGQAESVIEVVVDHEALGDPYAHKDSSAFLHDNFPNVAIQAESRGVLEASYRQALRGIRERIAEASTDAAKAKAARKSYDSMVAALIPFWATTKNHR